jgi:predicted hydrocarbon binding protein
MRFLGSLAGGIEEAVGETANGVTYLAGKNLGKRFAEDGRQTQDIEEALGEVRSLLSAHNCLWLFEPFKPKKRLHLIESTPEGDQVMLVFRDCMIRQSLFMFGHAQKGSLCNMMFGFFAGALERVMGRASELEIIHAGENACYKRLTVRRTAARD